MVRKKQLQKNYEALVKDLEEYGLEPAYRGPSSNVYNYLYYSHSSNKSYQVEEERKALKRYRAALETAMDVLGARAGYELLAEDSDYSSDPLKLFIQDLERAAKTVQLERERAEAFEAKQRLKGRS